ncbi:transposable element Tcb2 transposase [Trichonephila clavipes]|nr:transposable element Tcb2 transposase [Trichonephila clavipes]
MFMPGPKRSTLQAMLVRLANGTTDGDHIISDVVSGTSIATEVIDVKTDAICEENVIDCKSIREDLSSLSGFSSSLNSFLNIGVPHCNTQVDSDENGVQGGTPLSFPPGSRRPLLGGPGNEDDTLEAALGLGELASLTVNNEADTSYDISSAKEAFRKTWNAKYTLRRKDLIDKLKIFGMSSQHHIDDFMHGRIIGKIEEGRKTTDVAREFDIAHSVVSRLWKSFKTTGMCSRRHGEVVLEVRRLQKTDISFYQQKGTGAPLLSRWQISFLLPQESRSPEKLSPEHRTARLQWCREHHNWTKQDWACVLFSDESRFSLSLDCRRQLIWRESGTAYRPENIQEKDRYPTCSIMVWAGIMINGRTRLHVVANGTMTGQRYIDEVLLPHVCLFHGAVGDKFVFMDDNATCHRTLAVQDCLDSEGIQRLVWPARSPDLNPIENVWDALGRQVAGRNYPPTNKNTLIRALTEEWDKLPQQLLDNVVQSMVRCVECCITLHGGHIPY